MKYGLFRICLARRPGNLSGSYTDVYMTCVSLSSETTPPRKEYRQLIISRISKCAAIATLAAVAACSNDVVAPGSATLRHPSASVENSAQGDYVLTFQNANSAQALTDKVAALGGNIRYINADAGLALVSGMSADAATQLGADNSVQSILADQTFSLNAPIESASDILDQNTIQSVANPATAARYAFQWNMRLIHANDAWAAGKLGSSAVTVAIIDSGIDYDAPDLNGLVDLSRSTSFVASDDAFATTFFPTRNKISDFNGHGTNVATQVSSKAVALAGVTSKTTLIGVKAIGWTGGGTTGNVLAGVLWAADHGANIANMSVGGAFAKADGKGYGSVINRVFNYASKKGMLIVVAAGNASANLNQNADTLSTYCDAPHVICVSSVGPKTAMLNQDEPAYYTNYGSGISVAAPGGNADAANGFPASARPWGNDIASWVWSYCSKTTFAGVSTTGVPVLTPCVAGNRLTGEIGTSQASPHVAGEAASILAEHLGMSAPSLKQAILKSADDLGAPGRDFIYGSGRINVARAHGL